MDKNDITRIKNIKMLRSLERIHVVNDNFVGIVIGSGTRRMFYNKFTGEVGIAYNNKLGYWKAQKNSCGRYGRGYLRRVVPGTKINVYCNVIAAVCLGWYDDDCKLGLICNHMNYNKEDNRKNNLELCSQQENTYHGKLRAKLKKNGLFREGMSFQAKFAAQAIKTSKDNIDLLKDMVDRYLEGRGFTDIDKHLKVRDIKPWK